MQSLNQFKCHTNCKHKECQRHANLGIIDRNGMEYQNIQQEVTGSSISLENILDMSNTLAQIMILCGIHECKAKNAIDIITYSFLHYDLVCYCLDAKPEKRLRKEDIFHELGSKCLMNRVEAHLCYNIIKRGFKAFYYNEHLEPAAKQQENVKSSFSEECVYVHAAKKTAETYGKFEGLSFEEQRGVESKIKVIYKKFFDRLQARKTKPVQENCNCCFCAKSRGNFVYGPPPSCSITPAKKPHICPHCCKRKKSRKLIHSAAKTAKCSVCHRSQNLCSCAKYKFDLNWVDSIWSRPDMQLYYKENIEKSYSKNLDAPDSLKENKENQQEAAAEPNNDVQANKENVPELSD